MPEQIDAGRLRAALHTALGQLLDQMHPDGYWEGELSSSALATATAVSALAVNDRDRFGELIDLGAAWLVKDQNGDGGWGDSPQSPSNLSTTLLAVAALTLAAEAGRRPPATCSSVRIDEHSPIEAARAALGRGREYLSRNAGASPPEWIAALKDSYGKDRTFAVPILLNCAIAGLVPWGQIPRLPFELAVLPHGSYRLLRLHVVSYALPALIAIGIALHHRNPTRNPLSRVARKLAEPGALRRLEAIQPASGGFLEATPLTSFVAMSLASASRADHPVTQKCLDFIVRSARPDGSWPIDSDLSVWVTTNALIALDAAGALSHINAERTRGWLLGQQHRSVHPYTRAAPGGWAWTHLPGGVPDADDTARAILALERTAARADLAGCSPALRQAQGGERGRTARAGEHPAPAVSAALDWLLRLQNGDGGWPTFCRGWGKLPFDRSSPDITAHALQALNASRWSELGPRLRSAVRRGLNYLRQAQRADGSWVPLWFGNQFTPGKLNPVFGTAAVLPALCELGELDTAARGITYLIDVQNPDKGWGGAKGVESSIEETAAVVSALAQAPEAGETTAALSRGALYLLRRIEDGTWCRATPIGLYFSSLWYSERFYPIIWMVEALGRVTGGTRTPNG